MLPTPLPRLVDGLLEATVIGSFTKIGPAVRSRVDDWEDLPDLSGRTIAISGVTSGLGRAAAERLGALGATLHVIGRSPERTEQAAAEIAEASGAEVSVGIADLSSVVAAADWARGFADQHASLDVLIHNAGALDNDYGTGPEGVETTFATHVLSPFAMTTALLPLLRAAHPGRVVTMTSGGMYTQAIIPEKLEMREDRYDGLKAYARAKRTQVALTESWARKVPADEVVLHAVHPGWADTPGVTASIPGFGKVLGPLLRSADEGADGLCWLAASDEATETSGGLWLDRRPRSTRRLPGTDHDEATADRAWEVVADRVLELTGLDARAAL